MPTQKINTASSINSSHPSDCSHNAHTINSQQRLQIALKALTRTETITKLSEDYNVSSKFIYKQKIKAEKALQKEFEASSKNDKVLYYIPVTKAWLRGVVLALLLYCHSSFRGIIAFFSYTFDHSISLGTIHNIVNEAVIEARLINAKQDLSTISEGAHDELFQGGKPVLTGIDLNSLYCYLLSSEDRRDAETWAINLWDLEKQGLQPQRIIADAGKGLRAGQASAWDGIPCDGDHFHVLRLLTRLITILENKAYSAIDSLQILEKKMIKAKKKGQGHILSKKLATARLKQADAVYIVDTVSILVSWLRNDVFSLNGNSTSLRSDLYDFIVQSLYELESLCEHYIRPVRNALSNQRNDLLAFAQRFDQKIEEIAHTFCAPSYLVREMLNLQLISPEQDQEAYWQKAAYLHQRLSKKFFPLQQAIAHLTRNFNRTSSLVENYNSRLRNYFFLRRQVGPAYLDLLRFFLNYTPFVRSHRKERQGKSPAEILAGQPHSHCFELLGFTRFRKETVTA